MIRFDIHSLDDLIEKYALWIFFELYRAHRLKQQRLERQKTATERRKALDSKQKERWKNSSHFECAQGILRLKDAYFSRVHYCCVGMSMDNIWLSTLIINITDSFCRPIFQVWNFLWIHHPTPYDRIAEHAPPLPWSNPPPELQRTTAVKRTPLSPEAQSSVWKPGTYSTG